MTAFKYVLNYAWDYGLGTYVVAYFMAGTKHNAIKCMSFSSSAYFNGVLK